MSSLQLRGLTVAGPTGPPLLDGVDLDVADGESVAVIGPSAASRTALLRTIVGLQAPDAGEILIDEVDVVGRAPRRRDVAMVFADHALHPRRDVLDNLTFAATLRRKHDRAELAGRVEQVVDDLALRDVLDLRPHRLGTDQQQRVAIGRSLVRDASVWLFDDPFSAQSERVRPHLRSVVLGWQTERGRTSVITTSSVDEALSLAGRVAVLHQGRVRQVGSPQELYEDPADMFVAGYLGSPPMNLLPAFRDGEQLVTPLATILVDERLERAIGDRPVVIAGIRPEHCLDATRGAVDVVGGVEFTTRVDDVEWRARSQYAFLGFDLDPALSEVLDEVEEMFEFDLFQNFLVAQVPTDVPVRAGQSLHVVVPHEAVVLFDPDTGENLTR
ncbi:MAG: ABC transporter ATP-binding protein [Aeromicrobium sp.]|uniref:ABC transporter ATP-binding protein n=1 Tax=Aeromicrobium sp. TaxID=1871063 RepID=UPI0025BB3BE0|nr:ABC transporter ATP-binding protein [Aeromicrobium sp.]MCK5890136.1 ABC transporter ATP-binding protein [Aeromicrobium sp.]MDF1703819.1 ABC transporter ATP-binding protein [Aeromicrobium sp.]